MRVIEEIGSANVFVIRPIEEGENWRCCDLLGTRKGALS